MIEQNFNLVATFEWWHSRKKFRHLVSGFSTMTCPKNVFTEFSNNMIKYMFSSQFYSFGVEVCPK